MKASKLQAAVEAILFASGEPVELDKIAEVLGIEPEVCEQVILNLSAKLDETNSGICVLKLDNMYQLSSRTEYAEVIRDVLELRKNTPLSAAAFEVLAVIAYNQPVTKAVIEQIRGVDCTYAISALTDKNLITVSGKLDVPGKPNLYSTTDDFLRVFGLVGLSELPKPSEEMPASNEPEQITIEGI